MASGAARRLGATYRLSIRDHGFDAAARLVPVLVDLGIETLYLAPIFTARAGSTHGYDVVDPAEVDPTLGGRAGLERLLDALDTAGMTALLDIVPNHVATAAANVRWQDVLRHGEGSASAPFFDIDWEAGDGRVVLPVLGAPLTDELRAGALTVETDGTIRYGERRFPLGERPRKRGLSLAELLARQHYRLCYWRLRTSAINYRRFFEIDDLVALRQEEPMVFEATHRLVVELCRRPTVAGVRIDHVDGLADPETYLQRLARDLGQDGGRPRLIVEKILERGEPVPRWPIDGTTGYEFADLAVGLFVDEVGARQIAATYRSWTGDDRPFARRRRDEKRRALEQLFQPDLQRTTRALLRGLDEGQPGMDLSAEAVGTALVELTAALGAYRLYGGPRAPIAEHDRHVLAEAIRDASPGLDAEALRALGAIGRLIGGATAGPRQLDALRRWQQLSSAIMAKGSEDTALFDPGSLLVGAEVGSDPDHPAVPVEKFHAAMARRPRGFSGLNTTSTHDTKRSEDVRIRLAALSRMPAAWLELVEAWRARHENRRSIVDGKHVPTVADELYFFETVVGLATPGASRRRAFVHRMVEHLIKAARERRRETSWSNPNAAYEHALVRYARSVLAPANRAFHDQLDRFEEGIEPLVASGTLGLLVLKVAAPGVPDFYQGTEFGRGELTDPDNRRSVDFKGLRTALRAVSRADAATVAAHDRQLAKLAVTRAGLALRRSEPILFERGSYEPLETHGDRSGDAVVFARRWRDVSVIAVVTRDVHPGAAAWGDTAFDLPDPAVAVTDALSGRRHEPSGRRLQLSELLSQLPVAILLTHLR